MKIVLVTLLVACAAEPAPQAPVVAKRAREIPLSEPTEYEIDRVSRAAGEAIFTRTGIGDPYRTGLPYPIFLALLRGYPQLFGGTTGELANKFGFVDRPADPASTDADVRAGLPLGMHLTTDPITNVPFVVTSCALCHAERLRWRGGEATIIGLANKRVRIHAYDAAFVTLANQLGAEKLSRLAREAAEREHVAWPAAYADALVAGTIAALRERAGQRAELALRTANGTPGRVATIEAFVPALAQLSGKHIDYAPAVGWAKVPDVIGFRHRTTLSWDGSGEGPMDLLAVEADIAAGVRVAWLERHPLQGASLGAYLRQPAARPRFPGAIDRALAKRGRALFDEHCGDCHGTYGDGGQVVEYDEPIVALADIGTDPARAEAATDSFAQVANDRSLTRGYTRFTKTLGYVPPVLTNVWARAPYGHVGQWPSLAVLAMPPEKRPAQIVVDSDAQYDLAKVGIAWRPPGTPRDGEYLFAGPSVAGHPFLAELGKNAPAVIEYLKTL